MFTRGDGKNYHPGREQQSLGSADHLPGNNDLFILSRLLPSSDDSNNNFFGTSSKTKAEITIHWNTDILGLYRCVQSLTPCPKFFFLFKHKAYVCTPKMQRRC
jgi:methionyl-tRNA formyltransferase